MNMTSFFEQSDKLQELLFKHYGNCDITHFSSMVIFKIEIPISIMSHKRILQVKYMYHLYEINTLRYDLEKIIDLVNLEIMEVVDKILKTL